MSSVEKLLSAVATLAGITGYNCNSCTTSVNAVAAAPISRIDITDTSESAHFLRDCQLKLSLTGAKKWQGKLHGLPIGGKKWAGNCPPCPIGSAASAHVPSLDLLM